MRALRGSLQACQPADGFDYAAVPPLVEKFLRGQAERIQRGQTVSILQTGNSLIEAKRHLSHGQFLKWIEREAGLHVRTAQAYMQVAQWAKGKSAMVARLPPSLLYLLSAPGTPNHFQARLLERLEAGERIDIRAVRTELAALRSRPRQPAQPGATIVPPAHAGFIPLTADRDAGIGEAVSILSRALSPVDFARIRSIMTSSAVLHSPRLPEQIVAAFETLDHAVEYQIPHHHCRAA